MAEKDGKSEEPTGKRKEEVRKDGNIPKSVDLTAGMMLMVAVIMMGVYGPYMTRLFKENMVYVFSLMSTFKMSDQNLIQFFEQQIHFVFQIIWPILLIMFIFGILSNLSQVGFLWTTKPLEPKFGKIFGMQGLKRLFSISPWMELLKGLAKIGIIGFIAYIAVKDEFDQLLALMDVEIANASVYLAKICFYLSLKIALLLICLGIVDFFFKKRSHHDSIKMSKQEVKDEAKQSEGDPHIKSRQRQLAMEMLRKSMLTDVPKATVVITNPTYIAIALLYERGQNSAPLVLAKGKRLIAEKIRDVAHENAIPVVENKPLARGMFDLIEVGQEIPAEFFGPVAEVLAYVYNTNQKSAQ